MTTVNNKKCYPSEKYLNELITNIEFAARAPVEVVRAIAAELQKHRKAYANTAASKDSWISCSERMPEETGDIIVVSDGIVMSGISYSRRDGFYMAALEYDDDEPIDGVTHWMPLPEPPQEVNRG